MLDHLQISISLPVHYSILRHTRDHSILFDCLQHWYGIDGVVLKWVQSYLNSRKQRIKIDIFQMLFNSLMGFLSAPSWAQSFLPYIHPLLVQSYLNSMLPITYMQTIHRFTWNLTLGTLILAPLNLQTALRQSRWGWEVTNLN